MPSRELRWATLFWKKELGPMVFSSHGIWRPAKEGFCRVEYTYHWYTQPNTPLTGGAYRRQLQNMGTAVPVDSFGPESGKVANMLFFPLHPSLFQHTKNVFVRQRILGHNPNNLALLIFTEGKETKYFSLEALDKIILPSLSYPKSQSIHMVVCRTLKMHHVVPIKRRWDTKVNPNPNPKAIWNSIPKEML